MDSRNKKVLIVLCLASLILVWRVFALLSRNTPSEAKAEPIPAAVEAGTVVAPERLSVPADNPTLWEAQQIVAAQPWGRDPFADVPGTVQRTEPIEQPKEKGAAAVAPPSALHFTGVSSSNDSWLAVVRGDIVRPGDLIDGTYTIVEITKRSITLSADGWKFRYELGSETPSIRPPSEKP